MQLHNMKDNYRRKETNIYELFSVPSTLHTLSHLILTATLRVGIIIVSLFREEKTEIYEG